MMNKIIKDRDLAKITNRLQVPLIIGDILSGEGTLTDDVYMGLHEILSDDQPDSALLSIALSAYTLANRFQDDPKVLKSTFNMLIIECERIIAEYGMIWLQNAQAKTLDDNMVFETLVHIPEDLECLGELLNFATIILENHDADAAQICTILSTQAGTQSLIAETFLENMVFDKNDPWSLYEDEDIDMMTLIAAEQGTQTFYTNNVIQFPVK